MPGVPVGTRTTHSPEPNERGQAAFIEKVKALAPRYGTESVREALEINAGGHGFKSRRSQQISAREGHSHQRSSEVDRRPRAAGYPSYCLEEIASHKALVETTICATRYRPGQKLRGIVLAKMVDGTQPSLLLAGC